MAGDHDRNDEAGEEVRFGGYVAVRTLGRGGMGTVHEARHPTLGKRVAIKAIHGALAGDAVAAQRFMREAQAVARINHPHVVDVFDVGLADGRPYIVMELLEGETLEALLARRGAVGVERAVNLLLPLVSAIAAIHDAGVVHRDIKPSNVMLARRGRFATEPVILDFSVSHMAGDDGAAEAVLTEPNVLMGTLPYLSPEQLRDARGAGPASDQYALGVLLYECLTGRKPFAAADRYELIHAAMTAPVTPPSATSPAVPAELDRIVLRALARRPEARHPTARAFGSALLPFAGPAAVERWAAELAAADPAAADPWARETASDVRPPTLGSARRPAGGRRRALPSALVGAGLVAAVVVGLAAFAETPRAVVLPPGPGAAVASGAGVAPASAPEPLPPVSPPRPAARVGSEPVAEESPAPTSRRPSAGPRRAPRAADAVAREPGRTPAGQPVHPAVGGKRSDEAEDDDAIEPFGPVR